MTPIKHRNFLALTAALLLSVMAPGAAWADVDLPTLTAIRVEALTDASFPANGDRKSVV